MNCTSLTSIGVAGSGRGLAGQLELTDALRLGFEGVFGSVCLGEIKDCQGFGEHGRTLQMKLQGWYAGARLEHASWGVLGLIAQIDKLSLLPDVAHLIRFGLYLGTDSSMPKRIGMNWPNSADGPVATSAPPTTHGKSILSIPERSTTTLSSSSRAPTSG